MAWFVLAVIIAATLYAVIRVHAGLPFWTLVIGAILLLVTLSGVYPLAFIIPAWILFAAAALIFNVPALRKTVVSAPLLRSIKKKLPAMSETERVAIEAGTVWWEAELFRGNPDFQKLFAIPRPHLTAEEQAFVSGPVQQLCEMLDDWQITHEIKQLPDPIWNFIRKEKFLGMIIPRQYGGLEFSAQAHSEVVMKLASRSVTGAVSVMVPNSLGPAELLLHYGTEAQKKYYLPRLAIGEDIPCFALTGPKAGSDAGAMPDYGVVCKGKYNGKEVLGFRLNWEKRYITLGPIATVLGLAFKAYDPDHLLGEEESLGITCALIPTDLPGITIGDRHYPLDSAFQNGPNFGKNVFIPMEMIIGGQERIGQGWRMLMESLAAGRGISLPALSTAAGKHTSLVSGAYARIRKQFHLPIGQFEGIEEVLARIGGFAYLMDAARQLTTVGLDQGERPSVVSAIMKYNLTEMMRVVMNDAMDLHGGKGICMGPGNYLARTYQSIPISITVEGANILTRSLIIFGQGAIRCHPHLLKELEAAHLPDQQQALHKFDAALMSHLGYALRNFLRTLLYGLSGSRLAPTARGRAFPDYYRQLGRMSAAFALLSDLALLTLGGGLKRKEKLSGRFADALSHLYLASAALKRFEDQLRPESDQPLLHWSVQYCLFKIQTALDGIIRHFPVAFLRPLLSILVFPYGRRFHSPNDRLGHQVAQLLQTPSDARERLVRGTYRSMDPHDPVGSVELALQKTLLADPIERRLHKSGHEPRFDESHTQWLTRMREIGQVSEDEANILSEAEEAIARAIRVDHFPQKTNRQVKKQDNKTHEAA